MKRKLTILWLMLLVGAAGLRAAEAYTYFDPADGSLNFCYDTNRTSRKNNGYNTYDLNTGSNTPAWYSIRSSVKELYFYTAFADYRPTTCYRWADGMSNLTKVTYINRLNTSQVTNMADMFNGCSKLKSLDLSTFDTRNVISMFSMFEGCSSLTALDLGNFDTSNVTAMYRMFYGCTKLEYVDLYSELFMSPSGESSYESTFVTSKVGDMRQMFYNCSSLKSLAFPGLSLKSTTKTTDMFYKCTAVTDLYVANDLTAAPSTTFAGLGTATKPVSLETVVFPSNATFTANYMLWKGGYFIDAIRRPFAVFDNGALSFYYENPEWAEMIWSETFECYRLSSGTATPGWSSKATSVTKVEFKENFKYVRPTSCYKWFDGMTKLSSITGMKYLNTSEVTIMTNMFQNCKSLKTLDLSGLNISNVERLDGMFKGCSGLTSINLSSFGSTKAYMLKGMFSGCSSLTSLDLSNFKPTIEDISYYEEHLVNYETYPIGMREMFSGCSKLESLDISKVNFPQTVQGIDEIPYIVKNYEWGFTTSMFNGCKQLKRLTVNKTMLSGPPTFNGVGTASSPCELVCGVAVGFDYLMNWDPFGRQKTFNIEGGYFKAPDPEYVDLGLPSKTLWATHNVGSVQLYGYSSESINWDKPEYENFAHFAWGEKETKLAYNLEDNDTGNGYSWSDYEHANGTASTVKNIGSNIAGTKYDVATDWWGSDWSLPTKAQWDELVAKCTFKAATVDGESGYTVTGPNGKSIFLPFLGYSADGNLGGGGFTLAYYWSSEVDASNARNANALYIKNDGTKKTTVILRRTGVNVRAVRTASTPTPQYAMGDVNHDGVITVIDASLITEYVLGNTPAVFFVANADVNNDGSISVTDVSKIVEIVLGGSGPVTPPTHEYVDLGLTSKTLWATCNVGATSPEGYGNYYAWGETKPKDTYSWATYQYCNGSSSSVVDLGNSIAGTAYDAATANWGSEWVMPTVAQIVELLNQCKLSFATVNGEKGLNLTGPNGKSIFFPMTGYKDGGSLIKAGEQTYLWSSRKDLVNNVAYKSGALYLERTSTSAKTKSTQAERRLGLPIRAVRASSAGANEGMFETDGILSAPVTTPADDAIYNLQGMKMEGELQPGIYVRNGKKYEVK